MNKTAEKNFLMKENLCKIGWKTAAVLFSGMIFCGTAAAEKNEKPQAGYTVSEPPTRLTIADGQVMRYGNTWIWQIPPNLLPDESLQEGNENQRTKIQLKKSDEIQSSFLGVNTSGMPRSRWTDYQPLEAVNLLDGDPQTCWLSRGTRRPEQDPAWVRLDFPREQSISRVVIVERPKSNYVRPNYTKLPIRGAAEVGQAMPARMKIDYCSDGFTWNTLFEGETATLVKDGVLTVSGPENSAPIRAKSLKVTALESVNTENFGYSFSVGELQVLDEHNTNIAHISQGTGIVASSTEHGRNEIEMQRVLWPVQVEAGFKWSRIGYHDDPINWHEVERKRGVFEVDPVTDAAITELCGHGIEFIMCLNFGNRLYTMRDTPKNQNINQDENRNEDRPFPQLWEWYYDSPNPPTTPEEMDAWEKYVRFMVSKYRDRIHYFELWNEWNISLYWGGEVNLEAFVEANRRAARIVRELAPDAKILMGSMANFPHGCAHWSPEEWEKQTQNLVTLQAVKALAPLVDVLAWHPYYQPEPENLLEYPQDVRAFKKWCESVGFHGSYMSTEWTFSYNYPDFLEKDREVTWRAQVRSTEMEKAKYVAQCYLQDAGLGLVSFFCEIHQPFYGALDLSLFRRSADADPVTNVQPEAAFYAVRNIAAMTDGFVPEEFPIEIKDENQTPISLENLRFYTFRTSDGGRAAAFWFGGKAQDVTSRVSLTITVPFCCTSEVYAFDTLNGVRQTLQTQTSDRKTTIRGIRINDVPLVLCFPACEP